MSTIGYPPDWMLITDPDTPWCDEPHPDTQPWELDDNDNKCRRRLGHNGPHVANVVQKCPSCFGLAQHSSVCSMGEWTTTVQTLKGWL